MMNKFHSFHMVTLSPWPIISANLLLAMTMLSTVFFLNKSISNSILLIGFLLLLSYEWWSNVIKESTSQGYHQIKTMEGIKLGMILFIASEVLFFLSFFWAYFHSSVSPIIDLGQFWPPILIEAFNPMNVPLLNTIILLSSGVSVTWAHHLILNKNFSLSNKLMLVTCLLGIYFSILQGMEYLQAGFNISDSTYGSVFFMATGFHGIHVLIGTTFLLVITLRMVKIHLNYNHLLGFEMAAWYWHFVDVVWLFLYSSIYWWGY